MASGKQTAESEHRHEMQERDKSCKIGNNARLLISPCVLHENCAGASQDSQVKDCVDWIMRK